MDDKQIKKMIVDLDYTGDGEISPEEFAAWWLNGRRSSTAVNLSKVIRKKMMNPTLAKSVSSLIEKMA
tara:strand:- start:146 stop:349 length:204 start_codon:yes stop_codon:yes gene_type:complete